MNLRGLYCDGDDFWQDFAPQWQAEQLSSGERQRQCAGQLHALRATHTAVVRLLAALLLALRRHQFH